MNILRPTLGSAEVLGVNSRDLGPRQFAEIGYVSENQELPGWITVKYFMAYLKPFYPTWDDALAEELLRQFDLPLDRKLRHLSRGMWMKAALASSLAYRPQLIGLDERFTGLDPLVRDEFIEGQSESLPILSIDRTGYKPKPGQRWGGPRLACEQEARRGTRLCGPNVPRRAVIYCISGLDEKTGPFDTFHPQAIFGLYGLHSLRRRSRQRQKSNQQGAPT